MELPKYIDPLAHKHDIAGALDRTNSGYIKLFFSSLGISYLECTVFSHVSRCLKKHIAGLLLSFLHAHMYTHTHTLSL